MPAYVLIRETKKEGRARLRVCISMVAGLGLASALLGGTAYGPALAAGLLRFIPFLAPTLERAHAPPATARFYRAIWIKANANGQYFIKGSADGVPMEFMIDSGATNIVLPKTAAGAAACRPAELRCSDEHGKWHDTERADNDPPAHHRRLHRDGHSSAGERRRTRPAVARHELAPSLPIRRYPKRNYDAQLLRNLSCSMSAEQAGCRKRREESSL